MSAICDPMKMGIEAAANSAVEIMEVANSAAVAILDKDRVSEVYSSKLPVVVERESGGDNGRCGQFCRENFPAIWRYEPVGHRLGQVVLHVYVGS